MDSDADNDADNDGDNDANSGVPANAPCISAPCGFTLVEAVVALGLLIIVLSGLATVWLTSSSAANAARQQTLAVQLARDKLEQLASLTWSVQSVDGVDLLMSDTTTDLSRQPATATGFGTRPSPDDTLRVSRSTYADYLDTHGRWIGGGTSPPPRAHFIRRWWIGRAGLGASELLLFQVKVTTVAAAAASTDPTPIWWRSAQPPAAWLCGAKLRRSIAS